MQYSIIVIGDELLIGQVTDTNSGWIARHLTPFGWNAKRILTVADDEQEIIKAVDDALSQTDVVLVTGGLGPTKDDITKRALMQYFGGELYLNKEVEANVQAVVASKHLTMNELTQQQALVPTSCRIIENEVGTAPIMWFEKNDKVLVSMPGVPYETETMMERQVISHLMHRFHSKQHIEHRTFVVINKTETELAMALNKFEENLPPNIHLAYLPKPNVIRLRLTGLSEDRQGLTQDLDNLSKQLHQIIGLNIVSDRDKPLAAILGDMLKQRKLTVSSAESCTGGNIAHEITLIPGSSEFFVGTVVSYTNEVKHKVLNVSSETLNTVGAVSQSTVEQMARGVSSLLGTNCAISTSGIAGPGGAVPGKPVGTVWMAAKYNDTVVSTCKQFPGDRAKVIERATTDAITLLINLLQQSK